MPIQNLFLTTCQQKITNRTVGEIPEGHDKLLFAWERGSKLFVTDAEPVRPNRAVFWKQFLKQQATMYKTPEGFEKKVGMTDRI